MACASWLRGSCMVAGGVVVFVGVFGLGFSRGILGFCRVVLRHVLSHGVFSVGIWRVRVVFGGFLGQIPIFRVCCADWASVLAGVLG